MYSTQKVIVNAINSAVWYNSALSSCTMIKACKWEEGKVLGRNQLIFRLVSAARPNLGLENPTFLGQKNEVSATADMWLQGRIDFFMQHFVTVHFPAN